MIKLSLRLAKERRRWAKNCIYTGYKVRTTKLLLQEHFLQMSLLAEGMSETQSILFFLEYLSSEGALDQA